MGNLVCDQAQPLRELVEKDVKDQTKRKIITVSSGKGGVGKSSITINLAVALGQMGVSVLVIDADFGLANVDVMLGISTKFNLSHVLSGEKSLSEIIETGHSGIRFISGGSGIIELTRMDEEKLGEIIRLSEELPEIDVILIDTGAGISDNIIKVVLSSSEVLVVATPEPTSIVDAYALIKTVSEVQPDFPIRLIMNKSETKKEAENSIKNFQSVTRRYLGKEVVDLGYILYDTDIPKSIKQQTPVIVSKPAGASADMFKKIANNLMGLPTEPIFKGPFSKFLSKWRN